MPSRSPSRSTNGGIETLDFDSNRHPPSTTHNSSNPSSPTGLLRDDESFFSNVVEGAIERDRNKMRRQVLRYISFASAILSCLCAGSITAFSFYGPLFLKHLHYTQSQVNVISTTAELAMYLPVPLFGYLCDRFDPRPLSFAAGCLFGIGYGLAASTYGACPPLDCSTGLDIKLPFQTMVFAFVGVGAGTSCMYLSAVTTCAKNFGKGKHKGLALAMPIAAFGLSGMWQSQVGSRYFTFPEESHIDVRGDLDVFRYFQFLARLLFAVGLIGTICLRVVDEEKLIEGAVEDLERSGLHENSSLIQRSVIHDGENANNYGTLSSSTAQSTGSPNGKKSHDDAAPDPSLKKTLLNIETRLFFTDYTMWLLAAGFFLTTGPGEAFINNLGTIIGTLYPPPSTPPSSNSPATHVSIVAITSTIARLLTGTLSDLLAPTTFQSKRITVSRLTFLLSSTLLFSLGQLLLATGLIQNTPALFPLASALVGLGYGAVFSLTPIIVSVVWGVQNFGTNWGIVAVVPAAGAAIWGAVYSAVYQAGVDDSHLRADGGEEQFCYGERCYQSTFWGMAVASWVAVLLWSFAWRGWKRREIAV